MNKNALFGAFFYFKIPDFIPEKAHYNALFSKIILRLTFFCYATSNINIPVSYNIYFVDIYIKSGISF